MSLLVVGGDHQHRDFIAAVQGAKGGDELQAVHFRHHVIDDDQVGHVVAAPFERGQRPVEEHRAALAPA